MDQIFDWCVRVLVYWAAILGITYKEINVWVFVILWPILTIILFAIILKQRQIIQRLSKSKIPLDT
jgi:hypothetical protein